MQLNAIPLPELNWRVAHCDMLDKLIQVADGDAALLYLYLLRNGNPSNGYAVDDIIARRELRMTQDRYERAVFTLSNLTLSSADPDSVTATATAAPSLKRIGEPPNYTSEEMYRIRQEDHRFEAVCQSAEEAFGCVLKEKQLRCLLTAYDYLDLSADAIIEMLAYLKREKGTVRLADMQRESRLWANVGVRSAKDAQQYLARKTEKQPLVLALCKGLGIDPAQASPQIKDVAARLLMQGFPPETIELAMRRSERQQGEKKLDYVLGILSRWHLANVHMVSEITALEPETRASSATPSTTLSATPSTAIKADLSSVPASSSTPVSASVPAPVPPSYETARSWRDSIWDDPDDPESSYDNSYNNRNLSHDENSEEDDEEERLWHETWLRQFQKELQRRKEAQTKDDV